MREQYNFIRNLHIILQIEFLAVQQAEDREIIK